MSLKIAPERPTSARRSARTSWSLATRLTIWNAGASFILILAATGFLYWALIRNLDQEDDRHLADKVRVMRSVLANRPGDAKAMRQEVEEAWNARQHTGVLVRITSADGQIVAETPGMSDSLPPVGFPIPSDEPGTGENRRSAAGRSYRVQAVQISPTPARPHYVVQVAMDRSHEDELLEEYQKNIWIVLGAALVLCSVVGYRIARRGLRPVHVVTETVRRTGPDHLAERIEVGGLPGELLALADTFNTMLDRLEASFNRLAQFSADIAHELRTPVNNLRGEVEVALGRPRTPDEYRDVLGSALEECGRLSRLIDSLLFLARAEHPETQTAKERLTVRAELATVSDYYEAAAGEKGVKLIVTAQEVVQVNANRSLFQRAVENLVSNAITHTPPGGTVTLTANCDGSATTVEVSDTGAGIAAGDLPHVFDRFYRADRVRSSSDGHVGLGLAIVKSIMDLHGGSVDITSALGKGTRIALRFPPVA